MFYEYQDISVSKVGNQDKGIEEEGFPVGMEQNGSQALFIQETISCDSNIDCDIPT